MIILDATTKSLEVVLSGAPATTQLVYTADFVDVTVNNYTPGSSDGLTNSGTAVTVVAAPAASTQRQVKLLTVHNQDTAAAIVTVQVNNASTIRKIATVTLAVNSTLVYTDGEGFRVIDTSGGILSTSGGGGLTLPITAAADDVVLQDSGLNPLIALDAAEVLTLSQFNVGVDGSAVFAGTGDIRWGKDASIFGLNGTEDADVPLFQFQDGTDILIGSDGTTNVKIGDPGTNGLSFTPNDPAFRLIVSGGGTSSFIDGSVNGGVAQLLLQATDALSNSNSVLLEAPGNANAFYVNSGTPDLGTAGSPWKDGYFSGTVEMAAGTAAAVPTQTNVTGSRALNTTYTAGARSIMVLATVRCAVTLAGGNAYVQAKSDGSAPPTTIASGLLGIQAGLLGEDNSFQLSFVVAAGQNYRIDSSATNGSVTLGAWFEVAF